MANTFDSYYGDQPYRSFRDLEENGVFPDYGFEDEIPDEMLDPTIAGDMNGFAPYFEDYPPIG